MRENLQLIKSFLQGYVQGGGVTESLFQKNIFLHISLNRFLKRCDRCTTVDWRKMPDFPTDGYQAGVFKKKKRCQR